MRKIALALLGLCVATSAFGQAVGVQQQATRVEAATAVAFAQAGVGVTSTATIVVPAGLYAYITALSMDTCADATGGTAQVNSNYTSTNLPSTPSWSFSFGGTANTCAVPLRESFSAPLKSAQPGVNVTVVSPSGGAGHNQFTIRVYYYLAP